MLQSIGVIPVSLFAEYYKNFTQHIKVININDSLCETFEVVLKYLDPTPQKHPSSKAGLHDIQYVPLPFD